MVLQNAGYVKHKIDHFETTEDGAFLPAQGSCSSANTSKQSSYRLYDLRKVGTAVFERALRPTKTHSTRGVEKALRSVENI